MPFTWFGCLEQLFSAQIDAFKVLFSVPAAGLASAAHAGGGAVGLGNRAGRGGGGALGACTTLYLTLCKAIQRTP